jgi:hypothetical protein
MKYANNCISLGSLTCAILTCYSAIKHRLVHFDRHIVYSVCCYASSKQEQIIKLNIILVNRCWLSVRVFFPVVRKPVVIPSGKNFSAKC